MGIRIIKLAKFIPEERIDNEYFASYLDTSDEWIRKRTGISSRHYSREGISGMLKKAIRELGDLGKYKERVELVLTATISADHIMPSISSIVHQELDLKKEVFCADMNMACTGFVGSVLMAESFLKEGDYGICIGAEQLSSITDFEDRSTAMLFGDGVAIALVEKTKKKEPKVYGTQMSYDLSLANKGQEKVKMDGKNIYKFATSICPIGIKDLLDKGGYSLEEIDWVVLHQANSRIIDSIVKKLSHGEKFYQNIEIMGNTSSASIGLCLGQMDDEGLLKQGDQIILFAFGGGLTYGGTIVEWGKE